MVACASMRRSGSWSLVVAGVPLAGAASWLIGSSRAVFRGDGPASSWVWVDAMGVGLSFEVDPFAWLFGLIVSIVGLLVLGYSRSYFADMPPKELGRYAGLITAFAGSMLGLVFAEDLWTLFVFWELTSVTSFLLIGMNDESVVARASALRALLVTGAGGLAMLGGIAAIGIATGTTSFSGLAAAGTDGAMLEVGLVLVLLGAFTKSAQVPFHFWLPGAMAAPTPVSAYLHSATMVKAGVVLVARLSPMFAALDWWRPLLVVIGTCTMLLGGARALRQHDAKLLLAFGTVSQLGLLMVLFGVGLPEVTAAAVAVLVAHVAFKAALFMSVGAVDHATGSRDIRRLSHVGRDLPWLAGFAAVAGASMAGIPPTFGFVAKEAALAALVDERDPWALVALCGVAVGSVLTVAYTWRFWFGVFTDRTAPADASRVTVDHRPSMLLVAPVGLLAVATIAAAVAAAPVDAVLGDVARSLDPASLGHLVLWPGLHVPLAISAAIIIAGVAWERTWPAINPSRADGLGERAYASLLDGVMRSARRTAAVTQNGALPSYLAAVMCVVVAAAIATFAAGAGLGDVSVRLADSPVQAVVAAAVSVVAIAVAAVRRRFVAVVLLGGVGYGLALVFFLHGAPDLALTQVLVETLMIVVFMLVVRRLPDRYPLVLPWASQAWRIGVATAVGVTAAAFMLIAGTVRTDRPVTDAMAERAVPEAGGRNLVNVIIVDFRGIDTIGEITVLALAAIGVANLVHAARRAEGATELDPLEANPPAMGARSVLFDTVARMAFHLTLLVSVYVAFRGHNAPGGGFAGGLIAGAAFLMRFLAAGQPRLRRTTRIPPVALIAVGLAIASVTGVAGLLGGELLESTLTTVNLPGVGPVKLVSSTVLDLGVYVLVLGSVLTVVTNLGSDHPSRVAEASQ
ncbi:MAG: hydrogen gas-evolving membrane-bound hydrogenase subunit E [Ilumatobacteraceae bacterium]